MALRYNTSSNRFYDESNGRFVSRSRGMRSSVARADFEEYEAFQPKPGDIGRIPDKYADFEIVPTLDEARGIVHEPYEFLDVEMSMDDYIDDWIEDQEYIEDEEDEY